MSVWPLVVAFTHVFAHDYAYGHAEQSVMPKLRKEYEEQNIKEQKFFYTCFFISFAVVLVVAGFMWISENNRKSEQKTSHSGEYIQLIAS